MDIKPVTVKYAITEYGDTIRPILWEMVDRGKNHKKNITVDPRSV